MEWDEDKPRTGLPNPYTEDDYREIQSQGCIAVLAVFLFVLVVATVIVLALRSIL